LGATIQVPSVDGEETLHIPPGTQSGKVFRMKGKGAPHLRRNGRGDQLVVISVNIPTKLEEEQRQLFEQLAETMGTEVYPQEMSFLNRLKDMLGGLTD
jgi:molecular chaperone DnaJ